MSSVTYADVRAFIKDYLVRQPGVKKTPASEDLPEDCDLLVSGMVSDSIDFLNLLAALQEFAGRAGEVRITLPVKVKNASIVSLTEDRTIAPVSQTSPLTVAVKPFQTLTVKFEVE